MLAGQMFTVAQGKRLIGPIASGGVLGAGGHIDRVFSYSYIRSFAGVYVLLLRFHGSFDSQLVRDLVSKALKSIELLTLALPPPDGPGSGTAEGVGVA